MLGQTGVYIKKLSLFNSEGLILSTADVHCLNIFCYRTLDKVLLENIFGCDKRTQHSCQDFSLLASQKVLKPAELHWGLSERQDFKPQETDNNKTRRTFLQRRNTLTTLAVLPPIPPDTHRPLGSTSAALRVPSLHREAVINKEERPVYISPIKRL